MASETVAVAFVVYDVVVNVAVEAALMYVIISFVKVQK